jgi:hypothetical protein
MSLPPQLPPQYHSIKPQHKPSISKLKDSHRSYNSNHQNYSLMVDTSNIL